MQASVERQDALPAIRRTAALGPVPAAVPVHEPELEILCQRHHLAKLARQRRHRPTGWRRRPRVPRFRQSCRGGVKEHNGTPLQTTGGHAPSSPAPREPGIPARGADRSRRALERARLAPAARNALDARAGLTRHYGRPPASRLFTQRRTRRVTRRSWRALRTTGALAGIELGGKITELRITAGQ
jgi:hypothetical protein